MSSGRSGLQLLWVARRNNALRACTDIRPSGEVVLTRVEDSDSDDPVLGQFLGFLAADITRHPERLQSVDAGLVQRLQSLVAGVDVDLETILSANDE